MKLKDLEPGDLLQSFDSKIYYLILSKPYVYKRYVMATCFYFRADSKMQHIRNITLGYATKKVDKHFRLVNK